MCIDQANFTVKITNFGVSTSHENENAVLYHIMISTDSFLGRLEKGLGALKVCPLLGYLPTDSLMLTLGFSYTAIDLGEYFYQTWLYCSKVCRDEKQNDLPDSQVHDLCLSVIDKIVVYGSQCACSLWAWYGDLYLHAYLALNAENVSACGQMTGVYG